MLDLPAKPRRPVLRLRSLATEHQRDGAALPPRGNLEVETMRYGNMDPQRSRRFLRLPTDSPKEPDPPVAAAAKDVYLDRAPQTLDVLEPGVIVLRGPPVSGKASFFLQALLSAANKGLAVGYICGAHPTFVTRQLEAMLTYLGLTSKNLYLFPDAPSEAIEAQRLKTLIKDCNLNILCIDDFPDHLATKAEAAETISRETGCRVLIVTRPSRAKPPPPLCQLPDLRPAALPSAKRRRYGKPRGSRGRSP
jgi:hypothetical protein